MFKFVLASALAVASGAASAPIIDWRVKPPELLKWIPLDQTKSGLLIIDISVNGAPEKALIDTGATFFVVSDSLVSQSDIIADGYPVKTDTRSVLAKLARLRLLNMGPVEITNTPAVVADLSNVARSSGENIKFVLGSNVLKTFAIEIDRAGGRMRFLLPSQIAQSGKRIGSSLVDVDDARPVTEISVCGQKPESALIDTGYNNFLTIQDRSDFPENCVTKETEGNGVDFIGPVARKRATLRSVEVFSSEHLFSDVSIFGSLSLGIRTDKGLPPQIIHATIGVKAIPSDHFIIEKGGRAIILF